MLEAGKLLQSVPYEEYAKWDGIRASDLQNMRTSMAHFQSAREFPSKPTDALEFGRLFHLAMENGSRFMDLMAVEPKVDRRTKAGQNTLDRFHSLLRPDSIVIPAKRNHGSVHDWAGDLAGMIRATAAHPIVRAYIRDGVREVSLLTTDPETGIPIQCRPDFLQAKGYCVDFKTTLSAHPRHFVSQIFSAKSEHSTFYALSAAHYAHCLKVAGYGNADGFTIIAIEKSHPWGIVLYPLDTGCLGVGEQWRQRLMHQYAQSRETGVYPGYPLEPFPLVPPQYSPDAETEWGGTYV